MWKYQTALTLLLAAAITLMAGCIRPLPPIDSPEAYWARKMLWGPEYDVVLAGDSRINRGLSPSAMARHLAGMRIANFAFQSTGFTREYLDEVEKRLDPKGRRIIVIGVTTVSLTPRAVADNKFLEMKRKHIAELQQQVTFESVLRFFDPVEWERVNQPHHHRTGTKVRIYHPDGWTAINDPGADPRSALSFFEEYYVNNQVSGEIITELLHTVRDWTESGIVVVGFRPPTTTEMYNLEERLAGFDEKGFVKRFADAGGIWFDFPHGRFKTHDGSHLLSGAAMNFSKIVSRKISEQLNR